jgi:hypothetical protein
MSLPFLAVELPTSTMVVGVHHKGEHLNPGVTAVVEVRLLDSVLGRTVATL